MPSRATPTVDRIRTLLKDVDECTVQLRREDLVIEIFETIADNLAEIRTVSGFSWAIYNKLLEWQDYDKDSGEGRIFAKFKFLLEDLRCGESTHCYKN